MCTHLFQCMHVTKIEMLYPSELQCVPHRHAAFKCIDGKVKIDQVKLPHCQLLGIPNHTCCCSELLRGTKSHILPKKKKHVLSTLIYVYIYTDTLKHRFYKKNLFSIMLSYGATIK